MTISEIIKQLESIIENAEDMMESSDSDVWEKDKEACDNAIKILKEKEQMKYHLTQAYRFGETRAELIPDPRSITISRWEYVELLKIKASLECAQNVLDSGEFMTTRELYSMLGLKEGKNKNGEASE